MAVWMPVIVEPRSSATVAIDTFMTEESSAIRNCAAHSVRRTAPAAFGATSRVEAVVIGRQYPRLLAPTSQPNSLSNPRPSQSSTTRPLHSRTHHRTRLANLASTPPQLGGRNRRALRHLQPVAADRDLRTAG